MKRNSRVYRRSGATIRCGDWGPRWRCIWWRGCQHTIEVFICRERRHGRVPTGIRVSNRRNFVVGRGYFVVCGWFTKWWDTTASGGNHCFGGCIAGCGRSSWHVIVSYGSYFTCSNGRASFSGTLFSLLDGGSFASS